MLYIEQIIILFIIITGEYHQFDGIVQPEQRSWFGSKALKYFSKSQEQSSDKNLQYYQAKSMTHYLEDMKPTLTNCELSEALSIHAVTKQILHVFNQLFLSKVQVLQQRSTEERVPIHARIVKDLPEVMVPCMIRYQKLHDSIAIIFLQRNLHCNYYRL